MSRIILVAESGSDVNAELAEKYGIIIAPMYVNMAGETKRDGSFPVEEVEAYYESTGKVPQTSGTAPGDFEEIFADIHGKYPDAHILHLAYSAVTTVSYQSAIVAGGELDYVTSIDTKQVSFGQGAIVIKTAQMLQANPDCTLEECVAYVRDLLERVHMCFLPKKLNYLRAGGRVSNAQFIGATLLQIHPCIEIIGGYLLGTRKYRGKMTKAVVKMMEDHIDLYKLNRDQLILGYVHGMEAEERQIYEDFARAKGFREIIWMKAGAVITTHGGPGAIGVVGFS